ncbi:MAG TPA: hypothetical protein VFM73_08985 [Xanthomonadaceae bacterium]|nr:hypothetical protein [Xanthomonadaceae bacterium]
MDVALYRGRGTEIVLVHSSMNPPTSAERIHGPLRYLDTVQVDGTILADVWSAFADQMETRFFAVLEERDGLRLLKHRQAGPPTATPALHS